jgi:hypothetical protein
MDINKGASYWVNLDDFDKKNPEQLAKIQLGISNFVQILTGKNIPVEFASQDETSQTDGETVIIGANIKETTINPTVGIALHEASHIVMTDFKWLNKGFDEECAKRGITSEGGLGVISLLLNYVEDRRIDYNIYKKAPGYRVYYEEMYQKYFYDKTIDSAVKSQAYRDNNVESYLFRIINILNKNTDLDALPGLREIYNIIDIKNINRLKSTQDAFEVAFDMFKVIDKGINNTPEEKSNNEGKEGEESSGATIKDSWGKQFSKQKDFINHKIKKGKVGRKLKEQVNNIVDAQTNVPEREGSSVLPFVVTDDWEKYFSIDGRKNIPRHVSYFYSSQLSTQSLNKGINYGKQLLKNVKIFNEQRNDISENQKRGKIQNKKLYKAPFSEDIFFKRQKPQTKKVKLHLSVDMSGSMAEGFYGETLPLLVSMGYMALYLDNFDISITFRDFDRVNYCSKTEIILAYAFDSEKNTLSELKQLKNAFPRGGTPEGICYNHIIDNMQFNQNTDNYFLNISDGMPSPYFDGFGDTEEITKNSIGKMRRLGVGVMSFFISTPDINPAYYTLIKKSFKNMYGQGAQFINTKDMRVISKAINKLLLSYKK